MSCRSRAKRVRSLSTASRAFSWWATTRSMLRLITVRIPKTATEAAMIPKAVPTWLLPVLERRRGAMVPAVRATTTGAATRNGNTITQATPT